MQSKRVVLHFSRSIWDKPIVYRLIKDYNLVFNILKARVLPYEDAILVLEISGEQDDYEKGIGLIEKRKYKVRMKGRRVKINIVPQVIINVTIALKNK